MLQERRKTPRVRCYLPVRLYPQGEQRVIETLSKDLGLDGLSCLSPVHRPVASPLAVEINLGQGQPPLHLRATLSWFTEVANGEQFQLGLNFDPMTEVESRQLSRCIDRFTSHLSPTTA